MNKNTSAEQDDTESLRRLIAQSATKLCERHGLVNRPEVRIKAEASVWNQAAWKEAQDMGLPFAMLSEEFGGVGADHARTVFELAAAHALSLPLAETSAANWMLVRAELEPVDHPATFAETSLRLVQDGDDWRVEGLLDRVAWARVCDIVAVAEHNSGSYLVRIERGAAQIEERTNMAGEPRDYCRFNAVPIVARARLPQGFDTAMPKRLGAALRSVQLAGVMGAAVDMTVRYAQERRQFGRSIADFQAIQQLIAVMATQSAAAGVAARCAMSGLDDPSGLLVAVGKVRAAEAAGLVAASAHQVHGAIGFTREYSLQLLTRRLWAWRDEFGAESEWSIMLGHALASKGGDGVWAAVTAL